jgi:hypothetical protein
MFSLLILTSVAGGAWLSRAHAARQDGLFCVMDVVVELKDQVGAVVGAETYHKEFVLQEGGTFSDDFSTSTRSKSFIASLQKEGGDRTVSADWFADVSVFDAVDLRTSVTLESGDKRGKSVGEHTLFISGGSETTSYSLTCSDN